MRYGPGRAELRRSGPRRGHRCAELGAGSGSLRRHSARPIALRSDRNRRRAGKLRFAGSKPVKSASNRRDVTQRSERMPPISFGWRKIWRRLPEQSASAGSAARGCAGRLGIGQGRRKALLGLMACSEEDLETVRVIRCGQRRGAGDRPGARGMPSPLGAPALPRRTAWATWRPNSRPNPRGTRGAGLRLLSGLAGDRAPTGKRHSHRLRGPPAARARLVRGRLRGLHRSSALSLTYGRVIRTTCHAAI